MSRADHLWRSSVYVEHYLIFTCQILVHVWKSSRDLSVNKHISHDFMCNVLFSSNSNIHANKSQLHVNVWNSNEKMWISHVNWKSCSRQLFFFHVEILVHMWKQQIEWENVEFMCKIKQISHDLMWHLLLTQQILVYMQKKGEFYVCVFYLIISEKAN